MDRTRATYLLVLGWQAGQTATSGKADNRCRKAQNEALAPPISKAVGNLPMIFELYRRIRTHNLKGIQARLRAENKVSCQSPNTAVEVT